MDSKLKATIIMEIMGRPPEHIKEALNTVVIKMGSEKGVEVVNKKYHKPKTVEGAKNLYMTFAEIDAEFESPEHFFAILMSYMPSNVEIYEPDKFKMDSAEMNSLSNYIVAKLHNYDNIAKRLISEKEILLNQLQYIKDGGKIEDLIKEMGKNVKRPELKKAKSGKKKKKKSISSRKEENV